MTLQNIMDSTEKQLEDMSNELKSRSIVAVILESSFLIFLLSFLMVLDGWQLNNPPRYVAKPSDKDNSKYVRGITRLYRLMFGRFRVGSFGTFVLVTSQCRSTIQRASCKGT